jgi:hypothetical protein
MVGPALVRHGDEKGASADVAGLHRGNDGAMTRQELHPLSALAGV